MHKLGNESVESLLNIATPSTRQVSFSRIGLRSTGKSISKKFQFSSEDSTFSPSLLHITATPANRTHISRSTGKKSISETSYILDAANHFEETIADVTESILTDEDAAVCVCARLYQGFLDLYQSHPSENEIFDLLQKYEQLCADHAKILSKIMEKTKFQNNRTRILYERMFQERNTWNLIRILYQDRLQFDCHSSFSDILMDLVGKHYSDKEAIANLYERDSSVRQAQLVVDWLEKNVQVDNQIRNYNRMEFYLESHVAWENTLHVLKTRPSGHSGKIVTEMDPDATFRQKRYLTDLDREDEAKLFRHLFFYVRSGQLIEAQKLAIRYGYAWMAASLEGWRLHHDPNYKPSSPEVEALMPTEGNQNRDVWKAVCWHVINEENMSEYERAIYASLSGQLKGMLAVSQSWEDSLWAYMKTLLDQKIEQEIETVCPRQHSAVRFPQADREKLLSCEQVFQEIEASPLEVLRAQSKYAHYVVQKFIILNDLTGLVEEMHKQCKDIAFNHQVRFCAHFILFLQTVGLSFQEDLAMDILESYVKILIKEQRISLIATYTATLPPSRQVELYASFLENVTDSAQRQQCLELAELAGLDVHLITKRVVETIRSRDSGDPKKVDPLLTTETTPEDQWKIDAIDWLIFDQSQRAEAMKQANALMRMFVASRKVDAARVVLTKLPSDSIFVISNQWKKQIGTEDLPPQESNSIREYLCFQAYLMALEAFDDWFDHYHHSKPNKPKKPSGTGIKFTERVAFEHKMKQYESDIERWQQSLKAQTKSTTERLYNVLLFADGGWMADQKAEKEPDKGRQHQMARLRRLCIPQITTLLHGILHGTQQYKECIQLADIIADEKNRLYMEFSRQELTLLLSKLRETSLTLLDSNLDPLGYPYQ